MKVEELNNGKVKISPLGSNDKEFADYMLSLKPIQRCHYTDGSGNPYFIDSIKRFPVGDNPAS